MLMTACCHNLNLEFEQTTEVQILGIRQFERNKTQDRFHSENCSKHRTNDTCY